MQKFLTTCILISLFTTIGCVGETTKEDPKANEQEDNFELIDGVLTKERPEIGKFFFSRGLCTTTLIGPRVAITARHCVGYTTCDDDECASLYSPRVEFENPESRTETFRVVAFQSYDEQGPVPENFLSESINYLNLSRDDYWTSDDVALLLLDRDVPADVATPTILVDRDATPGELFTIWGYGCTDRDTRVGSRNKRRYDFLEGNRSNNLCPGDSGGPVTLSREGGLRYVNSAYASTPTAVRDVFGDILFFKEHINKRLQEWGQTINEPIPDPTPKNASVGDTCEASTSCNLANATGLCLDEPTLEAKFCSESCVSDCSAQADGTFAFCVSFDGSNGSCVPQPSRGNDFCRGYEGFVAVTMDRFVGQSGAQIESRTVCVPPSKMVVAPPVELTPPQNLSPNSTVQTRDIDLTWSPVAGVEFYYVELFYHDGTDWKLYHFWDVTTPGLRVTPVFEEQRPFYFKVASCVGEECSTWSEVQTFYYAP